MNASTHIRRAAGAALALATVATTTMARADEPKPFVSPLFADNMVLQRGMKDPIWGWADPGQSVLVQVSGGKTKTSMAVTRVGKDGKWMVSLPELPVGGPYTITISGGHNATLHNVLVGDVWICSGQSNMQFGIGNANDGAAEIAEAEYPNIRLFTVPDTIAATPRESLGGRWDVCTPATIKTQGTWNGFSAVAYFFGRDLYEKIHVPIGLIETDWGGTPAQAWTSDSALRKMPDFVPMLDKMAAMKTTGGTLDDLYAAWYAKNDAGTTGTWEDPEFNDSAWATINAPGLVQDSGIPELAKINGIIWYRRTFNALPNWAAMSAKLHLLADDDDTTWINGQLVGATRGYNVPREYALPAGMLHIGQNTIVVRVLDTGGKGGLWGDADGLNIQFANGSKLPLAGSWRYKVGGDVAKTPIPANPIDQNSPTVLYNGMIAPIIPFGIKGAIWYQGESNAGNAAQYKTLLPTMITDWRDRWKLGDFPFLVVQLANWAPGGDGWAFLRESQYLTAVNTPHVGLATAIDIGDVTDIHPKNKQEVGRRLALVAEAQVYDEKLEYSGPIYQSMKIEGSSVQLSFRHLGGGLVAKNQKPLTAFQVAGADGKYVAATAVIKGDTVVVSSPDVPSPASVRYAWSSNPEVSLYNRAGLPALPFRTDGP